MKNLLAKVIDQAQKNPQRIVFAETDDPRTLKAIAYLQEHKIVVPVLVGNKEKIIETAKKAKLNFPIERMEVVDVNAPEEKTRLEKYTNELFNLRKEKGMTLEEAAKWMQNPDYIGCMMTHLDEVDGMVSGANSHSSDFLMPIFQIIGTKEKMHRVSGVFFIVLKKQLLLYADCSVQVCPSAHELSDTAMDTAETARRFGIEPRVAFLAFSTHGSSKDPSLDRIREAVSITRDRCPDMIMDGEIQLDAAIVPEVGKKKYPDSPLKGNANVLIYPDLNSANIGYKLSERLAKAQAIGPILQGLRKPVNDLSRGCTWNDIVYTAAITACEAMEINYGTTSKVAAPHIVK